MEQDESPDSFHAAFKPLIRQAEADVIDLQRIQPDAVADTESDTTQTVTGRLDALDSTAHKCQDMLTTATRFLPPYDVRQAQLAINSLVQHIASERSRLFPRKKFAFKRRKKPTVSSANSPVAVEATSDQLKPGKASALSFSADNSVSIRDKTDETILLQAEQLKGSDVSLHHLRNCAVMLKGSPDALHISELTNCVVCIGPVTRSLLVSRCKDCTFSLACQQLRIHDTVRTDFYIHVTSRAIIEDCTQLRFAPYAFTYPGNESQFKESELSRKDNHWSEVNDFKWLKENEASPNWSVLPESQRRTAWPVQ